MATPEEVEQLRRVTATADNDETYTDELLGAYIDNLVTVEAAAAAIWREKAALLAGLVDVTESGSSRRLSQLHSQALKMAEGFTPPDDDTTEPGRASFTTGMERL